MTPRTDDPQQALVHARIVLGPNSGQPPTDDDVLFALLDVEHGLDGAQGTLASELEAARHALIAVHAEALLAAHPWLDVPQVSDNPDEPDPGIPGGGMGLSRNERILRRAHWQL